MINAAVTYTAPYLTMATDPFYKYQRIVELMSYLMSW